MTDSTLLDHFAAAVSAVSGVIAARGKNLDLFGVLALAVVTALGGGTLRDLLEGDGAVAWLRMPGLFTSVCVTAFAALLGFRYWDPPRPLFQIADALALCAFAVAGTAKGLTLGFAPIVSIRFRISLPAYGPADTI